MSDPLPMTAELAEAIFNSLCFAAGPQTPEIEPNPNGHRYGCECPECMDFYRTLK